MKESELYELAMEGLEFKKNIMLMMERSKDDVISKQEVLELLNERLTK